MNKKLPTVSIGVTAYNEGKGILKSISNLLVQEADGFVIEKLIVACDGCTDDTVAVLRTIKNPKLKILGFKTNKGKSERVNSLFKASESDFLVLFDADVTTASTKSVQKLVEPMIEDSSISLTSGLQSPIVGNTFAEKMAGAGSEIWETAKKLTGPNRVYYCSGGNRAFRRDLYKQMKFPPIMAEDIYPYLYAKKNGFRFKSISSSIIKYSLPKTLSDYLKRDKRYSLSPLQHEQLFGKKMIEREFVIKNDTRIKAVLINLLNNPLWTIAYLFFSPLPKLMSMLEPNKFEHKWDLIKSAR